MTTTPPTPKIAGGLPEPVGWRVRLSERGNNPWGPSPWHLESSEPKPSPREFYDVEQLHTADQMRAYAELCRAAPAGGDDLYRQACDSVEEWKARALEAEADIARIHAQINAENGPTFMGEPVVSAPAGSGEVDALLNKWLVRYNELINMDRTHEAEQVLRCINDGKRALLRKLQQGADYVVVPNRPTEAMEKAAAHWQRTYYDCDPLGDRGRFYRGIYDAMIAASQGQEGGTNG